MSRIPALDPAATAGKAKELLNAVQGKLGMVPNLARVLVHSPAALEGYLHLSGALAGGVLPATVREQIALAVGEANACGYCVSVHSVLGGTVGLSQEDVKSARAAAATDHKVAALLRFARTLVDRRGEVADADFARIVAAGATSAEIVEVVANVALNILTNYTNHVARTVIDFPEVPVRGR